jgi:hypothetical protein
MAQEKQGNGGFSLPAPTGSSPASSSQGDASTVAAPGAGGVPVVSDTSNRDMMIGGAVLLVLLVAFFFAKNGYANSLVAKKVPPNKANAAGWWLFVFLACLAVGVVMAAVNPVVFLAPLILGPIALVGLAALVLVIMSGRN